MKMHSKMSSEMAAIFLGLIVDGRLLTPMHVEFYWLLYSLNCLRKLIYEVTVEVSDHYH